MVSLLPFFSEASANMKLRFTQAERSERATAGQALETRTFGMMMDRIEQTDFASNPFGIGMGRGAAAISQLLEGRTQFVAGEAEFDRNLAELGPFACLAFTLFRVVLAAMIAAAAYARARENSDPLALLLVPSVIATLLFGVLEQPTEQGFMVLFLAFSLAAIRVAGVAAEPMHFRRDADLEWAPGTVRGKG